MQIYNASINTPPAEAKMPENKINKTNLIGKCLQPFWRLTRGQTLGAQGIIFNDSQSVLLVRHGYRPGWHFPGGGVEHDETILTAAGREIFEETGIEIDPDSARLHGLFANFKAFPGDHVALFIVSNWLRRKIPAPNAEIRQQAFFSPDKIPDNTSDATKRRLDEILHGAPISDHW